MELLITYQPNPTETRQKKWWLPLRFCIVPLCSGPAGDGSSPALGPCGPCGPCLMGLNPNMGFERWDIPRTKQRTSKQNITPTNLTNRTNHNEGTTWTQSGTSTPSQRTRMATPSDKTSETCDTKVCKVYPSVQGLQKLKNSKKPR